MRRKKLSITAAALGLVRDDGRPVRLDVPGLPPVRTRGRLLEEGRGGGRVTDRDGRCRLRPRPQTPSSVGVLRPSLAGRERGFSLRWVFDPTLVSCCPESRALTPGVGPPRLRVSPESCRPLQFPLEGNIRVVPPGPLVPSSISHEWTERAGDVHSPSHRNLPSPSWEGGHGRREEG